MTQIIPNTFSVSSGYTPAQSQSVIFDGSSYLDVSPISVVGGDRQKYIFSAWCYRSRFGTASHMVFSASVANAARFYFNSSDQLVLNINGFGNNTTDAVFRDVGWYHVGFIVNTTEAVSANRLKIMVNGIKTSSTGYQPPLNDATSSFNGPNARHQIGSDALSNPGLHFHGGMSDVNFLDGEEMTEEEFFNAFVQDFPFKQGVITAPKVVSNLNYGTDGFRFEFGNSSNFGEDTSGNNNDFTATGFVSTDQVTDVPGNPYVILNPLNKQTHPTISEGGLRVSSASGANTGITMSSVPFPNIGKWYYEHTVTVIGGDHHVGIHNTRSISALDGINIFAASTSTYSEEVTYLPTGNSQKAGVQAAYGATFTAGDVIGVLYDGDLDQITFYKNGVSQGVITGLSGQYSAVTMTYAGGQADVNFGQKPFAHTIPTGALTLKASNFPTPEYNGQDVFGTDTRTGTGASYSVTGSGSRVDFVWSKSRSDATSHVLTDRVRGVGKYLSSDSTAAEVTDAQTVTSFDVDGYSGGTSSIINNNGSTFVDWMWKAGGSSVTNNDGTISSQVSVAPEGHFSVSTATTTSAGDTFGTGIDHDLVILKDTGSATNWPVWAEPVSTKTGSTQRHLFLNLTSSQSSLVNTHFRSMSSSLVTVGTDSSVVGPVVSYAFKTIPGLLKVGKWTGNGSTNGALISLGFKARWVMYKNMTSASQWILVDTERSGYNVVNNRLRVNSSVVEGVETCLDITSNSFKLRSTGVDHNQSGNEYLFIAVAEEAGGGTLPHPLAR